MTSVSHLFLFTNRFHILRLPRKKRLLQKMEKFDIRLFLVLLFFGTSSAESATSEKVRYGSKSDYSLLKEDLKWLPRIQDRQFIYSLRVLKTSLYSE